MGPVTASCRAELQPVMNTWRESKKWLARRSRIGETPTSAGSGNARGRPGVCPGAISANHAGQIEQTARDDQALHLARALADRAELRVAQETLDWKLLGVTIPAVDLHGV
jgi:hypothetical protein